MKIWIITEGIAGTENQCLGVAETLREELGGDILIKRISLNQPWKTFSPFLGFESPCTFSSKGDRLTPPWPDVALCAGRKAIAAARYIKKASKGHTYVVQIQDPRISPHHFDLVAVPFHDPARGDNVIVTDAAPNRITQEKLEQARKDFSEALLSLLPPPRVAVLIGGNSKAHTLTPEIMTSLTEQLHTLVETQNVSLMVTTSRRTGPENEEIMKNLLTGPNVYIWDGSGENPYFGFLAHADYIIVTSDSVSMLSDAATTGKPVYMVALEGGSKRFDRFYKNLMNKNCIRLFDGTLEHWDYSPLSDSRMVASAIREGLKKRTK